MSCDNGSRSGSVSAIRAMVRSILRERLDSTLAEAELPAPPQEISFP